MPAGAECQCIVRLADVSSTADEALPRIRSQSVPPAFDLTHAALRHDPPRPELRRSETSVPANLTSTPEGAKVLINLWGEGASPLVVGGGTPLKNVHAGPSCTSGWRKTGSRVVEFATHGVVLLGHEAAARGAGARTTERASWLGPIDVMPRAVTLYKFEVTNRQFKEFVEAVLIVTPDTG